MVEKVVCAARALRGGVVGTSSGELHQRGESERREMLCGVTRLVGMNRDVHPVAEFRLVKTVCEK